MRSRGRRLYVGGAAGLLDDLRAEEIGAYRSLIDALEKRAALLDVLAQSWARRPFVRVGDELEPSGLATSRWSGRPRVGDQTLGTVSLLGPLRMDYEKALRTVRAAAHELSPVRRGGLRRRVARTRRCERHVLARWLRRPRLLRAARCPRDADDRRSRRRSASSPASCTRTCRSIPTPRRGSARRPRPTRRSRMRRHGSSTTLRARRPAIGRLPADELRHQQLRRPVLGVLRRGHLRRRPRGAPPAARTSPRRSRSTSSRRPTDQGDRPVETAVT